MTTYLNVIDENGFHKGAISEDFVGENNQSVVVYDPLPQTPLQDGHRWRWVGGAWVATMDYRTKEWYDPDNTDAVHRASTFDDAPPAGWVEWLPGQARVAGIDELLAKAKASRWEYIKKARDDAEYGGFTWDGSTFDSDVDAQRRISGAVTLASMSQTFTIDWTLADNSTRTLSAGNMIDVGVALGAHVAAQHATARAKRAEIEAAADAEAVNAVSW